MGIRFSWITLFLLITITSHGQLCNGSLGDPLVNITFGAGANPGAPLSAATTSYQFASNDCPNDGFYTVRNNTSGCFGNSWHTLNADHTGNAGGYFMLVNASVQPGAFYIDTVKGLCGGTTYEFAAWILNVLLPTACSGNGTQPNLTLTVEKTDGFVLQTYNTGNISQTTAPTWKQYGSYFATPAGVTDIVLRIVNNAPGGCGNDLALDDITFRPCGPTITGTVDGVPGYDGSLCQGMIKQFHFVCAVSGGFTSPVYQWQTRNPLTPNWTDISPAVLNQLYATFVPTAPPGVYQFRLAVAETGNINSVNCRIYSPVFTITIFANPITTAANTGPVCMGSPLQLSATGGMQYTWSGPGSFSAIGNPVTINNIQIIQSGKYYVDVTNGGGCTVRDSTIVTVNPVPTASTSFALDSICIGDNIQLNASGGTSYLWIPATGLSDATIANPIASPTNTTLYSVIVSNSFSCTDTATTTIAVLPAPVANAGPDRIIFEGQSTQLSGGLGGQSNSYSWSPAVYINDVLSLTPTVNPPIDQIYTLNVVSAYGCGVAADDVLVKVYKDIFIPTAFTPNNDGLNDTWNILGLEALSAFRVTVYNRWGEAVFHIKDEARPWNGIYKGVPLPSGVYVYFIEKGMERTPVKGTVMLIR